MATHHEVWRNRLKRQIEEANRDLEEEHEFWQEAIFSGPLSFMNFYMQNSEQSKGGSRPGKSPNIDRDRIQGHQRIWDDYFRESPTYGERTFRRRYRMRKTLFWRIHDSVCQVDDYFVQKRDAAGLPGLSSIQKITAAIQMLALGVPANALDEYVRIGESTALKSLKRFTKAIRIAFESKYLRQPRKEDMEAQFKINEGRGFPSMFASLDCMHYEWKNCPVAWQGLFTSKGRSKSIILEAVASTRSTCSQAIEALSVVSSQVDGDCSVVQPNPRKSDFFAPYQQLDPVICASKRSTIASTPPWKN